MLRGPPLPCRRFVGLDSILSYSSLESTILIHCCLCRSVLLVISEPSWFFSCLLLTSDDQQ